jgi:DNA-binding NarL/FixJ family response regulator
VSIRIALADDHAIVLHGLKRFLDSEAEFQVVRCCANGPQALEAVRSGEADILLLDVKMPGMSGLDVLRTMSTERLHCATVLLTAAVAPIDALEGLRLGARGIVLKESAPDRLLECIRTVASGRQWIDTAALPPQALDGSRPESGDPQRTLTARETEIVRMISHGLRNKAIAERLSISEGTVKIHLHNVYEKLGLDGRLELMLHAQKQGLV